MGYEIIKNYALCGDAVLNNESPLENLFDVESELHVRSKFLFGCAFRWRRLPHALRRVLACMASGAWPILALVWM